MRLARLQGGGSGRESRARAGRFGTIYALKGGIGMGGASFRAEPRGHHAAACTLRAATAWRHEGPPERILRAKPLRARSGKGSARKFPYVTEHGALGLCSRGTVKNREIFTICYRNHRIDLPDRASNAPFNPPPPHRGTISGIFPKSITEAPPHPGRERETAAKERPSGASAAEEGAHPAADRGEGTPLSRRAQREGAARQQAEPASPHSARRRAARPASP